MNEVDGDTLDSLTFLARDCGNAAFKWRNENNVWGPLARRRSDLRVVNGGWVGSVIFVYHEFLGTAKRWMTQKSLCRSRFSTMLSENTSWVLTGLSSAVCMRVRSVLLLDSVSHSQWGRSHSQCTNRNTQKVKNERFLISTRKNSVRIFGKCCLRVRQSDKRTNRSIVI